MLPLRNILCPIDFSASSLEALALAIELGEHFSATVRALHVLELQTEPAAFSPLSGASSAIAKHREELEANARLSMADVVTEYSRPSVTLLTMIAEGGATQAILQYAEETSADMIVISTHGRTGLRRLVFGSVAEAVTRAASCPVLIIRPVHPADEGGASTEH